MAADSVIADALWSSIKKDPHQNVDQIPINSGYELDPRLPLKHDFGAYTYSLGHVKRIFSMKPFSEETVYRAF